MGVETLIGSSTHVEGHLKVKGGLRVDGRVTGQLSVEGRCEVGADGYIEATVHATELTVAGRIAGDVEVAGRLHVLSTGAITGDVRTKVLVVEEGGTIEGKCSMGQAAPTAPARDGAAAEGAARVAVAETARS
ncbi:bactofilin family protein [Limnochorda pilosa]|nr:polymer-forming cytoskeletal protein [Limnochorda pilosa]